jgi:hypothetical protein
VFDQGVARKELALMICVHECLFSIVEHVGFRRFCAALQPLFKVMSRNTIRKDILDMSKCKRYPWCISSSNWDLVLLSPRICEQQTIRKKATWL